MYSILNCLKKVVLHGGPRGALGKKLKIAVVIRSSGTISPKKKLQETHLIFRNLGRVEMLLSIKKVEKGNLLFPFFYLSEF
tara:strand:- start:248 stop:490 length:243 start_codon:yes stop_codon:yes gene_type:complete